MSRSRLSFSPEEARAVLWVRCLEEADATGKLVPVEVRAAVSREANQDDDAAFLLKRSVLLTQRLPADAPQPAVPSGNWIDRLPSWAPWGIAVGAFVLGWLTNELGPSKQISILSFPLLGVILWNLTVCGISVWADWKARRKPTASAVIHRRPSGTDAASAAKAAFEITAAAWEKPRRHARMKWTFHAAALALAAGMVTGMYARGLGKEYKATWESTFLNRSQVNKLTGAVLGPASLITGIPVPVPPEKNKEQDAAPWIHLWAASALLFIGIPRLLLANMARIEVQKAQPNYRAEFESWLGVCRSLTVEQTQRAEVLPVHFEPEPKVRDTLRIVLQHLWGVHVSANFAAPVRYETEEGVSLEPAEYVVLMFPLATTPETEVHGALMRELSAKIPGGRRRLIALDASTFESRFRTLPEYAQRLAARRAAWEKVVAGAFPLVLLDEAARRDPAAAARSVFPA